MALTICGSVREVPVEELHLMEEPEPMGPRHHPISHATLLDLGRKALNVNELDMSNVVARVSDNNKKMLCTFDITCLNTGKVMWSNDVQKLIGIFANFQDQSGRVTMGAGENVFACDNQVISTTFQVVHKSTRYLEQNIRNMIWDGCKQFEQIFEAATGRQEFLNSVNVTREVASHHIIDAGKRGVINWREVPHVVEYWEEPKHEEFKPRNYWSLYNAFSGFFQDKNPFDVVDRSKRLNEQFEDIAQDVQETEADINSWFDTQQTEAEIANDKDVMGWD